MFICASHELFVFVFVLQQYVMLHDMVAAHSTVRVTVYRGKNGMAQSEEYAFVLHLSIFVMITLLQVWIACIREPGAVAKITISQHSCARKHG